MTTSNGNAGVTPDFWDQLRLTTQARIGLGRAGDSLPTRRVLEFSAAHASARDAVHEPLDADQFEFRVCDVGIGTPIVVTSMASTRSEYLRRPDLGRTPKDLSELEKGDYDIGFVLADGLSPRALVDHGIGLLQALVAQFDGKYSIAPPVIATEARVALGDHIAQAQGVRTLLVLIGERPGLSVADSLGIYLTHLPETRPNRRRPELHLEYPPAGRAELPAGGGGRGRPGRWRPRARPVRRQTEGHVQGGDPGRGRGAGRVGLSPPDAPGLTSTCRLNVPQGDERVQRQDLPAGGSVGGAHEAGGQWCRTSSAVVFDVLVRVFVDDRNPVDVLGLVGDEEHRDPMTGLQVDVPAEIGQSLVFLLAHVLVVGLPGVIDALPPRPATRPRWRRPPGCRPGCRCDRRWRPWSPRPRRRRAVVRRA